MASRLDDWLKTFEGERNPYPLALFRIAFFGALALHFFPSLIDLDDGYRRGALRTEEWNHWLFVHFTRIPHGALRALSVVTIVAVLCGLVGLRPRIAALVGGLGVYAFASFNGLHLHTLALMQAWALLTLFAVCGGGSAVWSVDAWLRDEPSRGAASAREAAWLPQLLLYQTLLVVFFSGVEKLLAGWPGVNEMGVLLSYPHGFFVRDWVVNSSWLHSTFVTRLFTWFTVLAELGTPILILPKKTRRFALLVYQAFFFGIVAMLEVPPLFYFMFAFGALLALDDDDLARLGLRRLTSPTTKASTPETSPASSESPAPPP